MRNTILAAVLLVGTSSWAGAAYWVDYVASTGLYPEQAGWTRHYSDTYGGALRYFDNGSLVIDSRANQGIYDFAEIDRLIDPGPGETFVAEWRVRVDAHQGQHFDQAIGFARDRYGTLEFGHYPDRVVSDREGWSVAITPGEFHVYRIESTDMIHYRLWIDAAYARDGEWDLNSLNHSSVGWGDVGQFGAVTSMGQWCYVRFGAIPEPGTAFLILIGAACCVGRRHGFPTSTTTLSKS